MASPVKSPQEEIRKLTNKMNTLIQTIEKIEKKVDSLLEPESKIPEIPKIPPIPVVSNKTEMGISTEVLCAALQSILNIQGVEYHALVKDAFLANKLPVPDPIPEIKELIYDEAVMVVRYGNDNFRKR